MVVSKSLRLLEQGQTACNSWRLTVRSTGRAGTGLAFGAVLELCARRQARAHSGTARQLALRLSKIRQPEPTIPLTDTVGARETCGATVSSSQAHSIRLPSYVIRAEITFGVPDQ